MRRINLFYLIALAVLLNSCQKNTIENETSKTVYENKIKKKIVSDSAWTLGTLNTIIISPDKLKWLEHGLSGNKIWVSNNPEIFRGNGWLMQNARKDSKRGGKSFPLSGTFGVYFFHVNKTGTTKYLHVMVTNPQNSSVTISGKGSVYTNTEKPMSGPASGQSYWVSRNWLLNNHRTVFNNVSINTYKAYQVCRATVNADNMVDGRFEITADKGVYVYTVITSSGSLTEAINATQGSHAPGDIYPPIPDDFGREAGVYSNSEWLGITEVNLPSSPAYIGFCLNTCSKFAHNGVFLQDQNAPFVMKLDDSSEKTYGNYGHKYNINLKIKNINNTSKKVRLSFGSNYTNIVDKPSYTYDGFAIMNGEWFNIRTTPTNPKLILATWDINAKTDFNINLNFYVPGLISSGQQLILEQLN